MLGYLPGLIHAWYIIAKNPEYDYEVIPDDEAQQGGRVTYYYISHEQRPNSPRRQQQRPKNYGTQGSAPPVPESSRPNNAPAAGPSSGARSDEAGAPPSYADAVKGYHKVQRQE